MTPAEAVSELRAIATFDTLDHDDQRRLHVIADAVTQLERDNARLCAAITEMSRALSDAGRTAEATGELVRWLTYMSDSWRMGGKEMVEVYGLDAPQASDVLHNLHAIIKHGWPAPSQGQAWQRPRGWRS